MNSRFGLPDTHGFEEDHVETGSFAENDALSGLAGHTAERTGRRGGTDEYIGIVDEGLHSGFVPQN